MLAYRRKLFFGVTRIQSSFVDTLGNPPRTGIGIGFWMRLTSGKTCFVTNRHNLDPALKFPNQTDLRLDTSKIELRRSCGPDGTERSYDFETRFFELDGKNIKILVSDNADCAVVMASFQESTEDFATCVPFEESDLADEGFFQLAFQPVHEIYFIGFAGRGAEPSTCRTAASWWDSKWNLPIARSAVVASMPFLQFNNDGIKTKDVVLASGMSFEGASGSPVISREVGFQAKPPISCEGVTFPKD